MSEIRYTTMESPVGCLTLTATDAGLTAIRFASEKRGVPEGRREETAVLGAAVRQLREYFDGERREFDLDLAPAGTAFQLRVWRELGKIRFGETTSYGELARRIGNPRASRAVGLANGSNPLPIVIPCHRVIGSDGSLTGYGGGLEIKRKLLALEQPRLALA